MGRCESCPLPIVAICDGETGATPGLCAWAASGEPRLVKAVVERAALLGPPTFDPAPAPAEADAPAPHRPGPSAWLSRVNTCPYRSCSSGCVASQCHWRRDDFGRPAVVSLAQCKACLTTADPARG